MDLLRAHRPRRQLTMELRRPSEVCAAAPLTLWGVVGLRLAMVLLCLGALGGVSSIATTYLIKKLSRVQHVAWSAGCGVLAVMAADLAGTAASGVRGGGVPEIRALYTGGLRESSEDLDSRGHPFLSATVFFAKLTSLAFAKGGGLPVGREGPFIHASCCATAWLLRSPCFKAIGDQSTLRAQLLLCAVAVGVAAAFRTPIAGTVFAIEVIAVDFNVSALWKLLTSSLVTVFVMLQLARVLNLGVEPLLETPPDVDLSSCLNMMLLRALVVGVFGGIVGVIFVQLNVRARQLLYKNGTPQRFRRYLTAAAVAAVVAAWPKLVAFVFLGVDEAFGDVSKEDPGAFNLSTDGALRAQLTANSIDDAFSHSSNSEDTRFFIRVGISVALACRELILAPVSLALPLTAGCVKPLYALGAFVGTFVEALVFGGTTIPAGATALMAAAATASSVTGLASAIALLEMTSSLLKFPVLVAALVAKIVAVEVTGSSNYFYDVQADQKDYRALPRASYDLLACATVRDACKALAHVHVAISDGASLSDVKSALDAAQEHDIACLPVLDRRRRFKGALRKEALLKRLSKKPSPRVAKLLFKEDGEDGDEDRSPGGSILDRLLTSATKTAGTLVSPEKQPFDLDDYDDEILDASGRSVVDTAPCSDLLTYLQRADFAFVVAEDRTFVGVLTRDAFTAITTPGDPTNPTPPSYDAV